MSYLFSVVALLGLGLFVALVVLRALRHGRALNAQAEAHFKPLFEGRYQIVRRRLGPAAIGRFAGTQLVAVVQTDIFSLERSSDRPCGYALRVDLQGAAVRFETREALRGEDTEFVVPTWQTKGDPEIVAAALDAETQGALDALRARVPAVRSTSQVALYTAPDGLYLSWSGPVEPAAMAAARDLLFAVRTRILKWVEAKARQGEGGSSYRGAAGVRVAPRVDAPSPESTEHAHVAGEADAAKPAARRG